MNEDVAQLVESPGFGFQSHRNGVVVQACALKACNSSRDGRSRVQSCLQVLRWLPFYC